MMLGLCETSGSFICSAPQVWLERISQMRTGSHTRDLNYSGVTIDEKMALKLHRQLHKQAVQEEGILTLILLKLAIKKKSPWAMFIEGYADNWITS